MSDCFRRLTRSQRRSADAPILVLTPDFAKCAHLAPESPALQPDGGRRASAEPPTPGDHRDRVGDASIAPVGDTARVHATHPSVSLDEADARFRHRGHLNRALGKRKGRVGGQGGADQGRDGRFLGKRASRSWSSSARRRLSSSPKRNRHERRDRTSASRRKLTES
jgi:hypothetical protein